MKLTTTGIDLAKNVFQMHGADEKGNAVLKKQPKPAQVLPFFANLTPCRIGMEPCGSAHYWARTLQTLGHTVQLIAPQYVNQVVLIMAGFSFLYGAVGIAAERHGVPEVAMFVVFLGLWAAYVLGLKNPQGLQAIAKRLIPPLSHQSDSGVA